MEVIRDPKQWVDRLNRSPSSGHQPVAHVLTIGVFDGLHVGHRHVIERVKTLADQLGVQSALVTFDPHPAQLLRPELAPLLLTGLDHKLELLAEMGVDTVVVVPFDVDRAAESAEGFVHSVLIDCLGARAVVVGEDFHFGKGRLGNVELLQEMGESNGFEVHAQPLIPRPGPLAADGAKTSVSSTAVRQALSHGDVSAAYGYLGRPHEVRGEVVTGDQRGRTIGFPTANVIVDPKFAIPADGVYAGWYITPDGSRHRAAVNIGRRPTFYEDADVSLIEAHLIGFEGDLYGQPARVQFAERLRGEQKFNGIDELQAQLTRDIAAAEVALAGNH